MNSTVPYRPRILALHHDQLLNAGLVAALRQNEAFNVVVMEAGEGRYGPPEVDVVVADRGTAMSLAHPESRRARPGLAHARILVLTSSDRESDIRLAIEAGVHGYVLTGGQLDELMEGVAAVANGMRFLGREVSRRMADSLTGATLTSREIDVLTHLMAGDSNKVIARRLQIEVGTVKCHVSAIMSKLGATSRTHAASIAASRGLVQRAGQAEAVRPRTPLDVPRSHPSTRTPVAADVQAFA